MVILPFLQHSSATNDRIKPTGSNQCGTGALEHIPRIKCTVAILGGKEQCEEWWTVFQP